MGLFSKKPKETPEEIRSKIENSETSKVFLSLLTEMLSPGKEWYQYLISDTRNNRISLKFYKKGINIEFLNMSRSYFKNNETYTVDKTGIGFGSSGYADLPNSSYVYPFEKFIIDGLKNNCPFLEINSGNFISMKETEKKGW